VGCERVRVPVASDGLDVPAALVPGSSHIHDVIVSVPSFHWSAGLSLLLLTLLAPTQPAQGQPASSTSDSATVETTVPPAHSRHATMRGWMHRHRLHVLDRSHSYGGWMYSRDEYGFVDPLRSDHKINAQTLELYDRGVFRHLTPNMDREYHLDLWTYRFTGQATYQWQNAPNGVRSYAGSIERTMGGIVTQLKQTLSIAPNHQFNIRARLQQDHASRRALLTLGYRWKLSDAHTVGARHTFGEYKPDLDATLFYRFDQARLGTAQLGVTFQNLYNNFLYGTLGVPPGDELLIRTYDARPYLLSGTLTSPTRYPLRGELHVSVQPPSTLQITAQNTPDFQFHDRESLHFLAGMVEYRFSVVTVGAFYRQARSRLHRYGSSGSVEADYTSTQTTRSGGGFLLANWWKLHAEVWGIYTQYRDHQNGTHFGLSTLDGPIDYRDPHRRSKIRVTYEHGSVGPTAGLEYLFFQRPNLENGEQMTRQWTGEWFVFGRNNYRLALILGYTFGRGSLTLGVGIDLDNDDLPGNIPDSPGRFDNGFGRLTLYW